MGGLFRRRRRAAPAVAAPLLVQHTARGTAPESRAAVRARAVAALETGEAAARAVLQPFSCLALRGVGCTTCVERCPVPGAMRWEGQRPVVEDPCTGCGECVEACPAPGKALLLLPAAPSVEESR